MSFGPCVPAQSLRLSFSWGPVSDPQLGLQVWELSLNPLWGDEALGTRLTRFMCNAWCQFINLKWEVEQPNHPDVFVDLFLTFFWRLWSMVLESLWVGIRLPECESWLDAYWPCDLGQVDQCALRCLLPHQWKGDYSITYLPGVWWGLNERLHLLPTA